MLVEIGQPRDRLDQVGRLVHDDHRRGAEAGAQLAERVEIHRRIDDLRRRHHAHRRAAGDDGEQIVPAAAHAAGMFVDQLAQWDAHRLFDVASLVHMAGDAKHFCAGVVRTADAREPIGAAAQNGRRNRDAFDIVDSGWAAIEPDIRRERRLETRLALLAFQAFEQRGFLAADIGASAVMDDDVEIPAVDIVLADQLGVVSFIHRALQRLALADEFAAHIDVSDVRAHREAGDQTAFHQRVRIVAQDVAVLAGAGFGFVGVDDQIMRPFLHFLRHEGPFEAGRKARAAAAAQTGFFDHIHDGFGAEFENLLGAVPVAARACAREPGIAEAVEIGEDAVAVGEHYNAPPPGARPSL